VCSATRPKNFLSDNNHYYLLLQIQSLMYMGGPSACGRILTTTRKSLVTINTTSTTSIHIIQTSHSFSFNTRASTSSQDTFKAPKLIQVP
jgi:hypothetical protein